MIKINKGNPPQILLDNQEQWTQNLLNAIQTYGSYSSIPPNEKKRILSHYKHNEIQTQLFTICHDKCAYCECKASESSYMHIDHFAPKSLYPNLVFDWDNLLPACQKCNIAKLDFDTGREPIVNPSATDNPETYFDYNPLRIVPSIISPDQVISQRTIDVCNLNANRLLKARAKLLCALADYENRLEEYIREIDNCTSKTQRRKIRRLEDSLEIIENLTRESEKYSGFCRNYVSKSKLYLKAKKKLPTNE